MTPSDYVTGWSHHDGTDRRTGRPMTLRTPHAVSAETAKAGTPALAECGSTVHELGDVVFSPTPSLASMAEPCALCVRLVGRR